MVNRELDAILLSKHYSIDYIAGFPHLVLSNRPMYTIVPLDGEPILLVPKLDYLFAINTAFVSDVRQLYFDIPSKTSYFIKLGEILMDAGLAKKRIGIEELSEVSMLKEQLPKAEFANAEDVVKNMRMIKSDEEIELTKKACEFADRGMEIFMEIAREGVSELEAVTEATYRISHEVLRELPEIETYQPLVKHIRLQAGPKGANHGFSSNRKIKKGDVIWFVVRGRSLFGYGSFTARNAFLGEPADKQKEYYKVLLEVHRAGVEKMKPGVKCCDVHNTMIEVARNAGYGDYPHQRSGFGIGLESFEDPYIAEGDTRLLQAGMIVALVPGLYVPNVGGFRCDDTILISEKGSELLTRTARGLESRII